MSNLHIYLSLICTLITTLCLGFNNNNYDIRHIDDVPQSEINYIYEDSRGVMWFATLDGLYRYDGKNFKSYQGDDPQNQLSSNLIISIDEDSHGNIWVGTGGNGIGMINLHNGNIINFSLKSLSKDNGWSEDVKTIMVDSQDNVWVGNISGVIKLHYDSSNGEIDQCSAFDKIEENIGSENSVIKNIYEDKRGSIWISSTNSLHRILKEEDNHLKLERYDLAARDICEYGDEGILVTAQQLNLIKYDANTNNYSDPIVVADIRHGRVTYRDGDIWVGNENGANLFVADDIADKYRLSMHIDKESSPFFLTTSMVSAIASSQNGQVWIGLRGGGVISICHKQKQFHCYPQTESNGSLKKGMVRSIFEDPYNNNLWIGTENEGIFILPKGGNINSDFKQIRLNSTLDRISAFQQTGGSNGARNVIWVGTGFPINIAAFDGETFERIEQDPNLTNIGVIISITKSDENTLWIGTYNHGLWRLKIDNNGAIIDRTQFESSADKSTLISQIIRSLYVDFDGNLFIGTDNGVNRIDKSELNSANPTFHTTLKSGSAHNLDGQYVNYITQNRAGEYLFGTMDDGMICYTPKTDRYRVVDQVCGLPNNAIKSIIEDPNNNDIWLTTNRGIAKHNPDSNQITIYNGDDRLTEIEFLEKSVAQLSNGSIAFGNYNGIVIFNPEQIKESNVTPNLFFTELHINHNKVNVGKEYNGNVVLDSELEYTSNIELKYEQRNFSVGFIGIDYLSPNSVRYQYKLEGIDNEWRSTLNNERTAYYTNIPEGDYKFQVRCANSDNVWSDKELELNITITPPIYRTTFAYILYVILFAALLFTVFYIMLLFARKKQAIYIAEADKQRAEELAQYKLEYFTNISHEFRTPLTLINIPAEKLLNKYKNIEDSTLTKGLTEIKYNVNVLMTLINQLLDFRKVELGKESVELQCVDINKYLELYFNHFRTLAEHQNVEYTLSLCPTPLSANIDCRLLQKVIFNIITNAFKHTPTDGKIELSSSIDTEANQVIIKLQDNGCGVKKEELPNLLNRFYQASTHSSALQNGSGIGLELSANIVRLLGGVIEIESDYGEGFTVIIKFASSDQEVVNYDISEDMIISNFNNHNIDIIKESTTPQEDETSIDTDKKRVLIVEDNKDLRTQLCEELKGDYQIYSAENGAIGVELCLKQNFDIIVTDIKMPKMDGIEMCQRIKECEEISHIPILVLTSESSVKSKIDSFTIGGAEGYMDKPFSLEVLKENINTILRNRDILKERFKRGAIIAPEDIARTPADIKCLSRITEIIKENISNSELTVASIAKEYGVSRIYLNRKIKDMTGATSRDLIRMIRLKYAANLIMQGDQNITEIMFAVGYTDANTFRNRFRDMYGVTPSNYNGEEPILRDEFSEE